jgi:hypothetical protein
LNQGLPRGVRIGWCHRDYIDTFYLIRYEGGGIPEMVKIGCGDGFLVDVDGDGFDELVVSPRRSSRSTSPRVKTVCLGASASRPSGGEDFVWTTRIYRLAPSFQTIRFASEPKSGIVADYDELPEVVNPNATTFHACWTNYELCWADVFGTGQPALCETTAYRETTYTRRERLEDKTSRALRRYWLYDAGQRALVDHAVDLRLPDKPSDNELTGLLRGTTLPASRSVPATRTAADR